MIDWESINEKGGKLNYQDLNMHSKLLGIVDAFRTNFFVDLKSYGIELDDHTIGYKQVVLSIDSGLKHIFIGIVDFELRSSMSDLNLLITLDKCNSIEEVLMAYKLGKAES